MEILGASLLTVFLVVGLVLLLTYALMSLGAAALGVVALVGIIGAILFGVGLIEGIFGGLEGFANFIYRQIGLKIATGEMQILALVGL